METLIIEPPLLIILLSLAGLGGGILAGLFGVGGGILFVPALFYTFKVMGYPEIYLVHMAVGTSLAVAIPATLSSYFSHKKKGNVDDVILKSFLPFLIPGVFAGAAIATQIDGTVILKIFAVFLLFAAFALMKTSETKSVFKKLPDNPLRGVFAFIVGALSTLLGIGGGTIVVPKLALCGVPMKKAVGTAAAVSVVVGTIGSISHLIGGLIEDIHLPYSIGTVNYMALLIMGPLGFAGAKIGSTVAHRIPANRLRVIFALFIVILSLRMLKDAFGF